MKKTTIILSILAMSSGIYAQTETTSNSNSVELTEGNLFQSIKPVDGQPVVFPTQEELDAKIDDKIEKIKQQLTENKDNPEKVLYLKEELWRFENAIVKTEK